jgi:hypothetical protein
MSLKQPSVVETSMRVSLETVDKNLTDSEHPRVVDSQVHRPTIFVSNICQDARNPSLTGPTDFLHHSSLLCGQPSAETFAFVPDTLEPINSSLSPQLECWREFPGFVSGSATPPGAFLSDVGQAIVHLPGPARLCHLLEVFFYHYNCYLPYLNKSITMCRIFTILEDLRYGDYNCTLFVSEKQRTSVALLCSILAMGDFFDPAGAIGDDTRPGWEMYLQGTQIIHPPCTTDIELDLVRYHTVAASYLIVSEDLWAATHAIFRAYQLASRLKVTNQKAWTRFSREEQSDLQKLWWVMYCLDRQISQMNGSAYIIRDCEMDVQEFTDKPAVGTPKEHGFSLRMDVDTAAVYEDDSDNYKYLRVLVQLGRIWGQIWDIFFAITANSRGDLEEIEIMDTRIEFLRRNIPPELTWNPKAIKENVNVRELEAQIGRRLLIYIVSLPSGLQNSSGWKILSELASSD